MTNFEKMNFSSEILSSIKKLGFITPTPVQEKVIPEIMNTQDDLIVLAQTGSGKTATFGLPIIQNYDRNIKYIQSLILCPTRELCKQIAQDIKKYAKDTRLFEIVPIYGGADIATQIRQLKARPTVIVGTPGRTLDLLKRGNLRLGNIGSLILDEADEMLNMGFKEELDEILDSTPSEKRVLLFSATMNNNILTIAKNYMHHIKKITIGEQNAGAQNLSHEYYISTAKLKFDVLTRLVDNTPDIYGIIFCRTRMDTTSIANKLIKLGYNVDALNGDLSQARRDEVMNKFKNKNLQILVATDVAARGIDVKNLSHIINYTLPDDTEIYIHRSGRTGRAGKKGVCISIIGNRDLRKIKDIQRMTRKKFEQKNIPTGVQVCQSRLVGLIDKIETTQFDNNITPYMDQAYAHFDGFSKKEIIKYFVSLELNRFWLMYKNLPDLNVKGKKRGNFTRIQINVGEVNQLCKEDIFGLLKKVKKGIEVGKIIINKKSCIFEVDTQYANRIIEKLSKKSFEHILIVPKILKGQSEKKFKGTNRKGKRRQKKYSKN